MPDEDASLTDFVDDDESGDDPVGHAAGAEPDEPAAATETGVEPAVPTATWLPDGACERCGAAAPRRWRDGDALVCADCRDW